MRTALVLTAVLSLAAPVEAQVAPTPQPEAPQTPPATPPPPSTQPPSPTTPPAPAPAGGQTVPPPGQTAPLAPVVPALPPAARSFTAETGLIFNAVRPERVVDFETVIAYLQEALRTSTDTTVQAQARGWQVYKDAAPGPNGTVVYVYVIDPVVPGADYSLGPILNAAYPDRIQEIWKLYTDSLVQQSLMNLAPFVPPPLAPTAAPVPATTPPSTAPPATSPVPGTVRP